MAYLQIYVSHPRCTRPQPPTLPSNTSLTSTILQILVECNVIILTGSATVLRPLWHAPARSAYQGYSYDISGSRPTHNRYASGTLKDHSRKHVEHLGDGTSEEYILDSRPGDAGSRRDIVRTMDYQIRFERDTRVSPEDPYLPDERVYGEHRQW